jgi:photosystem II stability/assembly factor-like uncharacterized protein
MNRVLRVVIGVVALLLISATSAVAAAPTVDPSLYGSLKWRNIGPPLGGRSIAVAGSVARPMEYYFGATGGGLWKTTNGGTDWSPVSDGQINSSSVGAIEVCPSDPDTVYIGMGEVELRGSVIPGDGVYKTTDGGKTWQHVGLADTQMIGRIRVDPSNCNRVFVAALGHTFGPNTERGVFRSTDGGQTWQKVLFGDDLTGAVDLSIDPSNPQVVYASLWHVFRKPWLLFSGGDTSGLFKSTDGGTTWTKLSGNPGFPASPLGKIGVAVSPVDPNRVYAIVEAADGGVYRSDDAGATWQRTNDSASLRQRAFYYTRIYADPVVRDRIYVLNTSFFRSDDAGVSFSSISTPHGDNHDLWISPDNNSRMIEGNDGGANVSTNGGQSWTDQDYSTAQMYRLATTDDDPYLVCGEQQDRGAVCSSSTGGDFINIPGGSESGPIAVDPRDSNVIYAGSCCGPFTGSLTRFDRTGKTGIGGRRIDPWPDNPMGHPARDNLHRFQWTYPLVTNPAEPDALFAGSQYVLKSTNGGQSWQKISPDLTYADPATLGDSGGPITRDQTGIEYYADVFAIAPSTVDPKVIWAGSDDGLIHITTQGGGGWRNVTPRGLAKDSRVSTIDAGHHDTATAYAAVHRYKLDDFKPYIYKTHSGGTAWTKITNGIPDGDFVWAVREDPVRRGLLYAATQHGAYVSFDDGSNWQSLSLNLPDNSVQDIGVKGGDVVIASHGRGFYVLDDGATLLRRLTPQTKPSDIADFHQTVPPAEEIEDVGPPPLTAPPTTHEPDAENAVAILRDPDNPVRTAANTSGANNLQVSYTLKQAASSATADFLNSNGDVVMSFTLPTTAGTRTLSWNLRYASATSFSGLIYWSADNNGPRAPLGTHSVRLTVDGQSLTQSFEVLKDPRLAGIIPDADIQEQFELALQVRNRTSDANQGVINTRACTAQIDDRIAAANSSDVTQQGTQLKDALSAVENELYQTRLRSNQDPLNFGIKLNNKIATLRSVIESIDSKPTDQTGEVFDLLAGQLDAQLDVLAGIVANDVPAFNALLQSHGLQPISCSAVEQAGSLVTARQRARGGAASKGVRVKIGRHVD